MDKVTIDGVQVLNVYTTSQLNLCVGIIFLLLCAAFIAIGCIAIKDKEIALGIFATSIGAIFTTITIVAIVLNSVETHYDVLIDDSVSFNSIYSYYEIDGNDGEIYHLTLRDPKTE